MTLKTRLAAMMILLLVAVIALQALWMRREQAALEERLQDLRARVGLSTRFLSERTLEWMGEGDATVDAVIEHLEWSADDSVQVGREELSVVMVVRDSTGAMTRVDRRERSRMPGDLESLLADMETRLSELGPVVEREERMWVNAAGETTRVIHGRGIGAGRHTPLRIRFDGEDSVRVTASADVSADGDDALQVHFAVPGGGPNSTVELVFPFEDVTRELERSRQRMWLWLAALLGVGALGAVLVAIQFTRPLQTLEASFGEVERGNLDVHVDPQRPDEIGRLTHSFNEMVERLRETRAMESRLAESERLASVGQMAAGVAHEVRNPLNAMRLTIEQLRAKAAPEGASRADFERYTSMVDSELERLGHLVTTFLDYSSAGEIVRSPIDVGESLREAAGLFESEAAAKEVRVEVEVGDELILTGDPSRLPTVWNNLLSNALAASPAGATVRIMARRDDGDVLVIVEDQGDGISPGDRERVFEPFFTRKADGTGLGLALVKSIVETHGGRVALAGRGDEPGTRATVRLPAGEGASA